MTIWFTSDPHYGHKNIITYCNRPWPNIKEMNSALIYKWNLRVKEEDHVYLLGDVAFMSNERANSILRKLHGVIYHIKGNHDKKLHTDRFVWSKDNHLLEHHDIERGKMVKIYMSHYYHEDWPHKAEGAWHLHGHAHGNPLIMFTPGGRQPGEKIQYLPPDPKRVDVGVDCWNYSPVSYDTLYRRIEG